jgi:hypothetical protein
VHEFVAGCSANYEGKACIKSRLLHLATEIGYQLGDMSI